MAILPIVTYNDAVLRQKADPVEADSEELQTLIDDMFETMYNSKGVGLAAPQVGKAVQLFVIDADEMTNELDDEEDLGPLVFINPVIIASDEEYLKIEEGCLSIPEVRDEVSRPQKITITYKDRNFDSQTLIADGWISRVIQHEYDHLRGILFLDYLSAFRRRLHRNTLKKIKEGSLQTEYALVPKLPIEQE